MKLYPPRLLIHADWSIHPAKRMMCRAVWQNGRYHLHAPEPVGPLDTWLPRLRAHVAPTDTILLGVDFPLGLPAAYAQQRQITDFVAWLPTAIHGRFFNVAETAEQISLERPFYPQRPGGTRQQHLLDGLNLPTVSQLRRRCDHARPDRRAAAPLFWTMGAQQVGKAAITGWRDLLIPWLAQTAVHLWPFAGPLDHLLRQPGGIVVAETYPAEIYTWLGLGWAAGGKRNQSARQANAERLLAVANTVQVDITEEWQTAVWDGFGTDADGEDRFDAAVGLLGLLLIVCGKRPLFEPTDPTVRRIEGWILGMNDETVGE